MSNLLLIVAVGFIVFAVINIWRRPGFFASVYLLSYGLAAFFGSIGPIVGIIAIAASLAAMNVQSERRIILTNEVPFIIWVVMLCLSLFTTPQIDITGYYIGSLIILSAGCYLYARTFSDTPGFFEDLLWGSLFLNTICAAKMLLDSRGVELLGGANNLQHVGLASLPEVCMVGLMSYLLFHRGHSRWTTVGMLVYFGFFLVPFAIALGTRSMFVSVGVVFLMLMVIRAQDRGIRRILFNMSVLITALATLLVIFWSDLLNSNIGLIVSKGGLRLVNGVLAGSISTDQSALSRLVFYREAQALILQHPIFGYGAGAFGYLADNAGGSYPHNMILELLVEGGLVGLLLFMAFSIPLAIRGFRTALQKPVTWTLVFPLGAFVSAFLRHQVSDTILSGKLLFLSLGCFAAMCLKEKRREQNPTLDVEPIQNRYRNLF